MLVRELHDIALPAQHLYVKVAPCILSDAIFATLLRTVFHAKAQF